MENIDYSQHQLIDNITLIFQSFFFIISGFYLIIYFFVDRLFSAIAVHVFPFRLIMIVKKNNKRWKVLEKNIDTESETKKSAIFTSFTKFNRRILKFSIKDYTHRATRSSKEYDNFESFILLC